MTDFDDAFNDTEVLDVRARFDFGRSHFAGTPTATCRECGTIYVAYQMSDLYFHECKEDK